MSDLAAALLRDVPRIAIWDGTIAISVPDAIAALSAHLDAATALMRPDTITVTPPAGFIAIPETVTVDEDGAGVVRIYRGDMS